MKTIPTNNFIELSSICELYEDTIDCNLIGIIKNGLSAGTVYKINDSTMISNNSYYILIKNNQYLFNFIYYWLLYNEEKLKDLSNLTNQSNLNKFNLLSFKIPIINLEKQLEIISYCDEFISQINRLKLDNKSILDKDILSTVIKLNN
jgi:restriction endonuclease S subunit